MHAPEPGADGGLQALPGQAPLAISTPLRGLDRSEVAAQLGREPLTEFTIVARCPDGHPWVIRNHPFDHEGKPFPTLFWLICPQAVKAASRLEADGWIRRLAEGSAPEIREGLEAAHRAYARERARFAPDAESWGGVGGARSGVKCLHAHYAHHLAGGEDPVGAWVAGRVEPVHPKAETGERVAVVDVGTNTTRLLVADRTDGDLSEVSREMIITRLGRGVDESGRFDPEALRRTLEVVGMNVRRARALHAGRIRVAATSAARDVADRGEFERSVEALTGEPPEILTGEQEAELSFLGATAGLDAPGPTLVFDIGGGSTELVLGTQGPQAAVSVDVGSVRITERVRPSDPPTEGDLSEMKRLAVESLVEAERAVSPGRAATLVGVAGTTTTVQAIALGLPRYDPAAIHRTVLTRDAAARVADDLASMTAVERAALPVMPPGREDVIVAGAVILLEILERWGSGECRVSERDLLDGLALGMIAGIR